MSRITKVPIIIPTGVSIKIKEQIIAIRGKKGELIRNINKSVKIECIGEKLLFYPRSGYTDGWAQVGTARSLLNSMIIGVTEGFIKKLELFGVGYRVGIQNNIVNLSLGFSHPINYKLPIGVTAECPSQTEIILKGLDKQIVGQVAADLRAYRLPEPYKGRGIHYSNEIIHIKEAKKK